MEAEAVVELFDALWVHLNIFQSPHSEIILVQPNSSNSSQSEEVMLYSSSPDSVLKQTNDIIISERESKKKRKNIRLSKSLSELEFEEVKGFMDIGFVFDEKVDSSQLVDIIPGLQRGRGHSRIIRRRPYLSEAWEMNYDPTKKKMDMGNEMEMKDCLKSWAHNVIASTLR